ncbi:MAG: polyprenyl synthetase family protein [Bacteroidia bacterium]
MKATEEIKHRIARLQHIVHQELVNLPLPKHPAQLYEPISYFLALGGKRLRPVLCLLSAELFGKPAELALPAGLAVELFHNFSLLHDDIMDKAPLRRGKPTVHEKYNTDVAILSGDALMVLAYEQLAKSSSEHVPALLQCLNKVAMEVCEGQQYDMDFQARDLITLEEYMRMIKLKTSVLLGAAMQMGAIVSGASSKDQQLAYDFGLYTGLAFQVQDDLLDVFGDSKKFGKKPGGDILANKNTYLRIKAMEVADENGRIAIESWYQAPASEAKVLEVTHLYASLGVRQMAEQEMQSLLDKAFHAIEGIEQANDAAVEQLKTFAHYLISREE